MKDWFEKFITPHKKCDETKEKSPELMFGPDTEVKIRKPNGMVEGGWRIATIFKKDRRAIVYKKESDETLKEEVSLDDLMALNKEEGDKLGK